MDERDLDPVLEMEKAIFSKPWTREMFIGEFSGHDAIVATVDGEIVAYLCGWKVLDEYQITNIGVREDFRRRGIGRFLMEVIIDARAKGLSLAHGIEFREPEPPCDVVFLEVRRSNQSARALYRNMGFRDIGVRKGYYTLPREDAVVMALVLPERVNHSAENGE